MDVAAWVRDKPIDRWLLAAFLFLLTVAFFILAVATASTRETTALENTLLQFLGIFAGAAFSWVIGDGNGRKNAEQRMHARARPAFRRVVRLYEAHGRIVTEADKLARDLQRCSSNGQVDTSLVVAAFHTIRVQVSEQIGTANDAMEDWRDLAPADVQQLEDRARRIQEEESSDVS